MNRKLLEQMLSLMADSLINGENIGDLKIGALYALGSQLEAIFYFCGHELASKLEVGKSSKMDEIAKLLGDVSEKYNVGKFLDVKVQEKTLP